MKIYDKDIYKKQEKITSAIIVILAFIIGFFAGYIARQSYVSHLEQTVQEQKTQLEDLDIIS